MKGIILAGGSGTRLYPLTKIISKQLLPVFDKPMIYYPLSVMLLAGIRDIMLISSVIDIGKFEKLLGDGSDLGIKITYKAQPSPDGLAQAFILAEEFIGKESVSLILGDNIFFGQGFSTILKEATELIEGALIFGHQVKNPGQFGVIELNKNNNVISLEEKPISPKSNFAVTGLYFYDNHVVDLAKKLKPSKRGELEITDINKSYLKKKKLNVKILGRGFTWFDTGTYNSLIDAGQFIQTVEKRQGYKIGCIEEIAFKQGFISKKELLKLANKIPGNNYCEYLFKISNS